MRKILTNKFVWLAILVALIVTLIMTIAQIPSAKATMQNIPVGIVNEDDGAIGTNLTKQVLNNKTKADHADKPMFKWNKYQNSDEAKKKLSFNGDYATVIIPKNLTKDLMSISKTGKPIKIKIIVNQGRNNTLSTSVTQILSGMFTNIGTNIGSKTLTKMANVPIPANKASIIANPFVVQITKEHKTTNLEAATSVFFQPIWITSLAVTILIYFASKSFKPRNKKEVLKSKLVIIGIIAGISILIGFSTCFYANWILGYVFTDPLTISIFLTIASFSFIILFSGFVSWLGLPGVGIFGILLFFGLPLLVMAPEMLPKFYQDWILPWLPMKFLYEGIRQILYFNGDLMNQNTFALLIISTIGLIMFFLETFNKRHRISFI